MALSWLAVAANWLEICGKMAINLHQFWQWTLLEMSVAGPIESLTYEVMHPNRALFQVNFSTYILTHWGRDEIDSISQTTFSNVWNENVWITFKISLKFVRKGPINNIAALVQIMAWRRPVDKPLSEPMMVSLPTLICFTRPQWANNNTLIHNLILFNLFQYSNISACLLIMSFDILKMIYLSVLFFHHLLM